MSSFEYTWNQRPGEYKPYRAVEMLVVDTICGGHVVTSTPEMSTTQRGGNARYLVHLIVLLL